MPPKINNTNAMPKISNDKRGDDTDFSRPKQQPEFIGIDKVEDTGERVVPAKAVKKSKLLPIDDLADYDEDVAGGHKNDKNNNEDAMEKGKAKKTIPPVNLEEKSDIVVKKATEKPTPLADVEEKSDIVVKKATEKPTPLANVEEEKTDIVVKKATEKPTPLADVEEKSDIVVKKATEKPTSLADMEEEKTENGNESNITEDRRDFDESDGGEQDCHTDNGIKTVDSDLNTNSSPQSSNNNSNNSNIYSNVNNNNNGISQNSQDSNIITTTKTSKISKINSKSTKNIDINLYDCIWMEGKRGQILINELEGVILCTMSSRHQPGECVAWRNILPTKMKIQEEMLISKITDLSDVWIRKFSPLDNKTLSALCVRFSRIYDNLQSRLEQANMAILLSDRPILKRRVYDEFSVKNISSECSKSSDINITILIKFLKEYDCYIEILEYQLSRCKKIPDVILKLNINRENNIKLLSAIGLPGFPLAAIDVIASSTIQWKNTNTANNIRDIIEFCVKHIHEIALKSEPSHSSSSLTVSSVFSHNMLTALFKPRMYGNMEHPLALLQTITTPAPSTSTSTTTSGASTSTSSNDIKLDVVQETLIKKMSFIPPLLVNTVSRGWCASYSSNSDSSSCGGSGSGSGDSNTNKSNTVAMDTITQFFYPVGISIRLYSSLDVIVLGKKISPNGNTDVIYSEAANQIFLQLRKTFIRNSSIQIPKDIEIYFDNEYIEILPKNKPISNYCVGKDTFFIKSEYIERILTTPVEAISTSTSTSSGSSKKAKVYSHVSEDSSGSSVFAPKVSKASTLEHQAVMEALSRPRRTFKVIAPKSFDLPLHMAYTWNVQTVVKYLIVHLELPQYEKDFLRCEIDGYEFISLDSEALRAADINNTIHVAKIVAHVQLIRKIVLEYASQHRPVEFKSWKAVHVAGWLIFKVNCKNCGMETLRSQIDGSTVSALGRTGLEKVFKGMPEAETVTAIDALVLRSQVHLHKRHPSSKNNTSESSKIDSSSSISGIDKKPSSTSTLMRHRSQRLRDQTLENDGTDATSDDINNHMFVTTSGGSGVHADLIRRDVGGDGGDQTAPDDDLSESSSAAGTAPYSPHRSNGWGRVRNVTKAGDAFVQAGRNKRSELSRANDGESSDSDLDRPQVLHIANNESSRGSTQDMDDEIPVSMVDADGGDESMPGGDDDDGDVTNSPSTDDMRRSGWGRVRDVTKAGDAFVQAGRNKQSDGKSSDVMGLINNSGDQSASDGPDSPHRGGGWGRVKNVTKAGDAFVQAGRNKEVEVFKSVRRDNDESNTVDIAKPPAVHDVDNIHTDNVHKPSGWSILKTANRTKADGGSSGRGGVSHSKSVRISTEDIVMDLMANNHVHNHDESMPSANNHNHEEQQQYQIKSKSPVKNGKKSNSNNNNSNSNSTSNKNNRISLEDELYSELDRYGGKGSARHRTPIALANTTATGTGIYSDAEREKQRQIEIQGMKTVPIMHFKDVSKLASSVAAELRKEYGDGADYDDINSSEEYDNDSDNEEYEHSHFNLSSTKKHNKKKTKNNRKVKEDNNTGSDRLVEGIISLQHAMQSQISVITHLQQNTQKLAEDRIRAETDAISLLKEKKKAEKQLQGLLRERQNAMDAIERSAAELATQTQTQTQSIVTETMQSSKLLPIGNREDNRKEKAMVVNRVRSTLSSSGRMMRGGGDVAAAAAAAEEVLHQQHLLGYDPEDDDGYEDEDIDEDDDLSGHNDTSNGDTNTTTYDVLTGASNGNSNTNVRVTAEHPLKQARRLLVDNTNGNFDSTFNSNIHDRLETTANNQMRLWGEIMSSYRIKGHLRVHSIDNDYTFRQAALLWVRLGLKVWEDGNRGKAGGIVNEVSDALHGLLSCCQTQMIQTKTMTNRKGESESTYPNRFEIAVVAVCFLVFMNKILDRCRGADASYKLLVFDRIKEGSFPVGELSRKDLKYLFTKLLGVEFSSWNIFDTICQRFNPGKHGFVHWANIVSAFQNLCPVIDITTSLMMKSQSKHISPFQLHKEHLHVLEVSQESFLMVITLTTAGLCGYKEGHLSKILEKILLNNADQIDSFRKFLSKRTNKNNNNNTNNDDSFINEEEDYNDLLEEDKDIRKDTAYLRDSEFIADLLHCILERALHVLIAHYAPDTDDPNEKRMAHGLENFLSQIKSLSLLHIITNIRMYCQLTSKALQIYNISASKKLSLSTTTNENMPILSSFSMFLVTFLSFRRQSLRSLLAGSHRITDNHNHSHSHSHSNQAYDLDYSMLSGEELSSALIEIEDVIISWLGHKQSNSFLNKADSIALDDCEASMAEMLGLSVPVGDGGSSSSGGRHDRALMSSQFRVESDIRACSMHKHMLQLREMEKRKHKASHRTSNGTGNGTGNECDEMRNRSRHNITKSNQTSSRGSNTFNGYYDTLARVYEEVHGDNVIDIGIATNKTSTYPYPSKRGVQSGIERPIPSARTGTATVAAGRQSDSESGNFNNAHDSSRIDSDGEIQWKRQQQQQQQQQSQLPTQLPIQLQLQLQSHVSTMGEYLTCLSLQAQRRGEILKSLLGLQRTVNQLDIKTGDSGDIIAAIAMQLQDTQTAFRSELKQTQTPEYLLLKRRTEVLRNAIEKGFPVSKAEKTALEAAVRDAVTLEEKSLKISVATWRHDNTGLSNVVKQIFPLHFTGTVPFSSFAVIKECFLRETNIYVSSPNNISTDASFSR
eukprot:gene2211-4299_t